MAGCGDIERCNQQPLFLVIFQKYISIKTYHVFRLFLIFINYDMMLTFIQLLHLFDRDMQKGSTSEDAGLGLRSFGLTVSPAKRWKFTIKLVLFHILFSTHKHTHSLYSLRNFFQLKILFIAIFTLRQIKMKTQKKIYVKTTNRIKKKHTHITTIIYGKWEHERDKSQVSVNVRFSSVLFFC